MAVHCSLRNLSLTTLFGCLMNKTTKWSSSINLANDRTSGKSFALEILGTLHRSLRRQTFQSKATNADNSAPTPKSRLLPIQFPPCPSLDQINHLSATSRHPTANKQPNCPCSRVKADWPHFITVKMIRVISESFNVPPSPPLMPLQPLNLTKTRLSLIIHIVTERESMVFLPRYHLKSTSFETPHRHKFYKTLNVLFYCPLFHSILSPRGFNGGHSWSHI